MSDIHVILDCVKSWPWQEFLATIIGAVFAFFLPTYYEHWRKRQQQKSDLINYYYNLHIFFRNYFGYVISVHKNMELAGGDITRFVEPPIPDFSFDSVSSDLSFVIKHSSTFYEEIVQLKIDLNYLQQPSMLSSPEHRWEYFSSLAFRSMVPGMQISMMLENTKRYLKKYYGVDVTNKAVENNISKFHKWMSTTLNATESNKKAQNEDLAPLREMQKTLSIIKKKWSIRF